ncbi:MAG: sarcosine oxidase subunit gamma [Microbacteriaceae bacterium]|nr:MAG: sarcosine oxidase subunit gamma [Microbacteriaceae bacterium]
MARGAVTGNRGVSLREIAFVTMISIRVKPDTPAASRIADVLGAPMPVACGHVSARPGGSVLWLGPDEFLAIGEADAAQLTTQLTRALSESPGLVVDLSANRTTLELSGPSAREVLQKGCTLDLHPRAFTAGTAVVTQLAAAPVILWQTDDAPTYRLFPRASFAEYTARWLLDAMTEFAEPELP